jgi:hypothetical protein
MGQGTMLKEIVGWDYYEDGEFCRHYPLCERAIMESAEQRSGGTSIPVFATNQVHATACTSAAVDAERTDALSV